MEKPYDLRALREGYEPSKGAKEALKKSGLTIVGNELAGSGKDALIQALIALPGSKFGFVPSRKTRGKRPGETLGVDFVRATMDQAVRDVESGKYIEWEPLRGTEINGTHMTELNRAARKGIRPLKDVEVGGQAVLRGLNPELRCIYPLPDLEHWIDMLQKREGLSGEIDLQDFLAGADLRDGVETPEDFYDLDRLKEEDKKRGDMKKRMEVAALQWELVWQLNAHNDPNTLFIVNRFGELSNTAALAQSFIDWGERIPHIASDKCMKGEQVLDYLGRAADIALGVLPPQSA